MKITDTQKIAYGFLSQGIVLLVLYVLISLVGAVKFLGADPLAISLPYSQAAPFASVLLQLAIMSLFAGGGVYAIAHERADGEIQPLNLFKWVYRLWTAFHVLACTAGFFNLLEGRAGLELPYILDIYFIVLAGVFAVLAGRNVKRTGVFLVWLIGLVVVIVATVLSLVTADFQLDRVLGALSVGLRDTVGYPLMAVGLTFWLAHRISNVTLTWGGMGAYSVGGFVTFAGIFLIFASLYTLDVSPLIAQIGAVGVVVIPVCCMIYASHLYRVLADRNHNATLAPHWLVLSVILYLLGVGLLGAVKAIPDVAYIVSGTRITDLQRMLILFSLVAVGLSAANQIASELRGIAPHQENRRVTGFVPFWLVSFGAIIAAIALAGAGLVQTYLERLLNVGYLETQNLIVPLYTVWVIGLIGVAAGVLIYGITFWRRGINT